MAQSNSALLPPPLLSARPFVTIPGGLLTTTSINFLQKLFSSINSLQSQVNQLETETSSSAISGLTIVSTVVLQSTDILNCKTTPFEVIAAPGSDQLILILNTTYQLSYNSVAYLEPSACSLFYGSPISSAADQGDSSILTQTTNIISVSQSLATGTFLLPTNVTNKGVYFSCSGTAPTLGNSSLTINAVYTLLTST